MNPIVESSAQSYPTSGMSLGCDLTGEVLRGSSDTDEIRSDSGAPGHLDSEQQSVIVPWVGLGLTKSTIVLDNDITRPANNFRDLPRFFQIQINLPELRRQAVAYFFEKIALRVIESTKRRHRWPFRVGGWHDVHAPEQGTRGSPSRGRREVLVTRTSLVQLPIENLEGRPD